MNAKRIFIAVLVMGIVGGSAGYFTNAFFSDTEVSADNKFTAGKLDLKLDGQDNPTAIINFTDLKPGDEKTFDKTLLVDNNPAWVWMHIKDLATTQGTQTDPETAEENGTPKSDIQDYLIYTLLLNGNPVIATDSSTLLPDAVSCWIPLGEIPGATDTNISQTFNFDSTVTNWAQGDTLTFNEEFYAVQSRNNPHPVPPPSTTGRVWSSQLKKCVPDNSSITHILFTCTSGCSGTYSHTLNLPLFSINSGSFSGTGFYDPDNSYTWTISGNVTGTNFTAQIIYNGTNTGYINNMTGTVNGSGQVSGTASDNAGQTFTYLIN